jgi:phosphoribosylanthranilate isomerase
MTTKAKICGIKTPEALDVAIAGGADYVGFVFCPTSPRHLQIAEAQRLAGRARGKAGIVVLTVDADDAALDEIGRDVAPDFLQLHGRETPERTAEIKRRLGLPVIKAIPVQTADDVAAQRAYANIADLILFDAKPPPGATRPGGHGKTFDWTILDGIAPEMAFMLSGGLTPENVTAAIRVTHPTVVDVSSGVETAPGVKDAELIRRFLQAVKTVSQNG